MNENQKTHKLLSTYIPSGWNEESFTPKHGVTKAISKEYFRSSGGRFNSDLYDRICDVKISKG